MNPLLKNPALVLKFTASVVYVLMGVIILGLPDILPWIEGIFRIALGILLVIYGGFRFYRAALEYAEDKKK